ncbi:F-box protein [Quillaja saponaria]|uniref:F-box protein n=1 Tax=Quillaja saponaria TaxID=32244 RepID=A0AAD7PEI6_QUISA|nr:F-box protein [Quillaja saponaria]
MTLVIPPEINLYALSKGYWTNLSVEVAPPYLISNESSQAYVNGAVHWIASVKDDGVKYYQSLIVLFETSDEVFCKMELPDGIAGKSELGMSLAAYRKSLLLFYYDQLAAGKDCIIWVMKEYSVSESWVKLFSIDMRGELTNVVSLMENGRLLLVRSDRDLVLYDPEEQRFEDVRYLRIEGMHSYYVTTCMKSLVLLIDADTA